MSKTVVVHQPDFLPHLAFFHRLLHADLFVILDTAQYVDGTSRSWMNRDKIKTPQGEKWLTVSVKKAPRGTAIREMQLSGDVDWKTTNLNLIRENYRLAPYYSEVCPHIEALYAHECRRLMDFNVKSIDILMGLFEIRVSLLLASELNCAGANNELLVDILKKVGATRYLSGIGARAYFDPKPFCEAGIDVVWQEFVHPRYAQMHGAFIPHLSSIDMLFNCGIVRSRELLRSC
jgi:hypothetical protein